MATEVLMPKMGLTMQQLRLRWHYRSRYEQLITFSNKNFYDNDLVTFPSSKADATGIGVDKGEASTWLALYVR